MSFYSILDHYFLKSKYRFQMHTLIIQWMFMNEDQSIPNSQISVDYFQHCRRTHAFSCQYYPLKWKQFFSSLSPEFSFPWFWTWWNHEACSCSVSGFCNSSLCPQDTRLFLFSLLDPSLCECHHTLINPFYSLWTSRLLSVLGYYK